MNKAFVVALTLAAATSLAVRAAGPRTFTVEPERSKAVIIVGKAGAFSFAGHTHDVEAPLVSGVVHFDPDNPSRGDVRLEFNAAAMRVTGKGESPDDESTGVTGDTLTSTGKFSIKQTDFGITPISVGGVVKVKDELNISFTIAARER